MGSLAPGLGLMRSLVWARPVILGTIISGAERDQWCVACLAAPLHPTPTVGQPLTRRSGPAPPPATRELRPALLCSWNPGLNNQQLEFYLVVSALKQWNK